MLAAAVLLALQLQPGDLAREVAACTAIEAPAERLACYDRAAGALGEAANAVPLADAAPSAEDRFGLTEPEPEFDGIETGVARILFTNTGRAIVTLENGQVWEQVEGDDVKLRIRGDDPIAASIKRGAFGTFRMRLEPPRKTIKVRRQS